MARINRRGVLIGTGLLAAAPILLRPRRAQGAEGGAAVPEAQALRVIRPRAEYIEQPFGLEVLQPRLSWACASRARGAVQSAYRISAASSRERLEAGTADLWDSGRVRSDRCFEVPYGGATLRSGQRAWWRVQLWDAEDRPSPPSEPAWFEMGLLQPADWQAEWLAIEDADERADRAVGIHWIWSDAPALAPEPQQFRYRIALPAGVRQAQLWLSAKDDLLGVWIDGQPVELPAERPWGSMQRIALPVTPGAHLIGVSARADPGTFMPGTGGALAAIVKIRHTDGTIGRFTSGPDWRTSRTAPAGWTALDFDDSAWPHARPAATAPPCDPRPPRPAMFARREFTVAKPLARARLYATALCAYEPHINGKRLGCAHLSPEITVAGSHVLYQCYDPTALLHPGRNALGALIGDGWYASAFSWMDERYSLADSPRRFLAQLVLEYTDGSRDIVVTDSDWRLANSMILSSEIYNGEDYDARLERPGWDEPGYDDTAWQAAAIGARPRERLVAQVDPPIRALQTVAVRTITQPRPGVYVCDLGQNFAGWCRLRVQGPAGTTVRLRHAEILYPDGNINTSNLRAARATDHYTLRGDPHGETYEPHFTYHGFRYVEITGFPGIPSRESIEGVVVHTDAAETGALELEQPIAQQIWHNALWSQRSNFFGVPTDCPQRDERMGWMGDIQVFLDAAAFNMDVDAFIRRFLIEVRAGQTPDGAFPIVTPQPRSFPELVTAGWSDAGVILPWTLYRRYGDTTVIEENWPNMQRWVDYLAEANPDFLWRHRRGLDLGDWLSVASTNPYVAPDPADATTPKMLVATAYWARCAALMAEMAAAIGHQDEAERYLRMRRHIERAFIREFVRRDGTVGNGSQTSYALSLRFGLVPAALRRSAGARLAANVEHRGNLLSTGFLGTPCLLDALADTGQERLAVTLLLQTRYPSWGYMIDHGATTMWERWNGNAVDQSMNSFNHYALGAVVGFMYRRIGGINEAAPGFRRIKIDPIFDARIPRVRAHYDSCLGRIATEVEGDARGLTRLGLQVPANSRAEVHLPGGPLEWRADGRPLATARTRPAAHGSGAFITELGSGTYELTRD